jgi:hypothetical protein
MLLELAQSPDGPVRLITGEPAASVERAVSWPMALGAIGVLVAVACFVWSAVALRAAVAREPSEYAFRALARRLRVPARHAALIRKLASCAQCAPVALLVSEHALHAAAMCFEKTGPGKRDAALVRQLLS